MDQAQIKYLMSFLSFSLFSRKTRTKWKQKNSSLPNSSSSSSLPHFLPILHSQIRFHIFTSSFSQQRLTTKNPKSFNPLKLSSVLHLRRTRRQLRRALWCSATMGKVEISLGKSFSLTFTLFPQISSSFPLWYFTLSFHFGFPCSLPRPASFSGV